MSSSDFENAFCQWLTKKGEEVTEEEAEEGEEQKQTYDTDPAGKVSMKEEGIPEVHQEAWQGQDREGLPVLKKMMDLPSQQGEQNFPSPLSSPLKITLSLRDAPAEDRKSRWSQDKSLHTERTKVAIVDPQEKKDAVDSVGNDKQMTQDFDLKEKNHQQCSVQSVVSSLSDLHHSMSPTVPRSLRVDPVKSPEQDLPMEPDSTSESEYVSPAKSLKSSKDTEFRAHEASPRVEIFPHSIHCQGDSVTDNSESHTSHVVVHVDDSQAECDSTSMFLASPSAISPSSQGEIEERVCPFLTDHEDGASPTHCVCPCSSLPPPGNFLPRNHVPVASSVSFPILTTPYLTVCSPGSTNSSVCKFRTSLVSQKSVSAGRTSDFEKLTHRLAEEGELSKDNLQHQNKIPGLFNFPSPCRKKDVLEHSKCETETKCSVPELKEKDAQTLPKLTPNFMETCEVGTSLPDVKCSETRVVSVLDEQGFSLKQNEKQGEICNFTKGIDWGTAVAETLESSAISMECEGDSKPGIILKIRTKAVVPCVESEPSTDPPATSSVCKRKKCSVDSPDILSRLRKRQKSGVVEKSEESHKSEQIACQRNSKVSMTKGKQQKDDTLMCLGKSRSCSKYKHNLVQMDGDLKPQTKLLTPDLCEFVKTANQLSRLQTLTHELMCTLFPHLRPHLQNLSPESQRFSKVIDDIIESLERSDLEETATVVETINGKFEKMTLEENNLIPVLSPQVVLCSSPRHSLEDFHDKICTLLQLLLPDIVVSFTDTLAHPQTLNQLEQVLKKMVLANRKKKLKKGS